MSSDLIKQTAFSNKDEKNTNHYDKITNKNFTNSQTATQDQERKYKKSYKHVIGEGGQMFYL